MTEVFSVSCFLIFTLYFRASLYCSAPLSHPLILPLCLCEEACFPAGPGCRDARLKSPRGERFLNPSCPPGLMQCISLLFSVFVRHSRRSITSDPSNDSLWASHPPQNPLILWVLVSCPPGQSNRGTECSQVSSVCDQRQLSCILVFSHIWAHTKRKKISGGLVIHCTGVVIQSLN